MFGTIALAMAIFLVPAAALVIFGAWMDARTTRAIRRDVAPATDWERTPADAIEARAWIDTYKVETGCTRCGYAENAAALDFAHRDASTKYRTATGRTVHPADMVKATGNGRTRYAWDTIVAEIAKCDVVCANCHRVETHAPRPRYTYVIVKRNGHTIARADSLTAARMVQRAHVDPTDIIPAVEWDLTNR